MCDACGTGGVVAGSVGCAVRDMRDLCAPRLPLSDASREVRDFVAAAGVVVPLGGFRGLCKVRPAQRSARDAPIPVLPFATTAGGRDHTAGRCERVKGAPIACV